MALLAKILIVIAFIAIVGGGGILYSSHNEVEPVVTPTQTQPAPVDPSWSTYSNDTLSFRYPAKLPTTYITATEWPPTITVSNQPYACQTQTNEMGETHEQLVQGREYCVATMTEGAAGSTYTSYGYLTETNGRTVLVEFTLRTPQCANYDEPQQSACKQEQANFDVSGLVDQMVQTIEFH